MNIVLNFGIYSQTRALTTQSMEQLHIHFSNTCLEFHQQQVQFSSFDWRSQMVVCSRQLHWHRLPDQRWYMIDSSALFWPQLWVLWVLKAFRSHHNWKSTLAKYSELKFIEIFVTRLIAWARGWAGVRRVIWGCLRCSFSIPFLQRCCCTMQITCVLVLGCCTTNQKMCKFPFFHRRKILLWARSICGNIDLGTLLCLSEWQSVIGYS